MLKPEYTPQFERDVKNLKRKRSDFSQLKAVVQLILEDTDESREELRRHHKSHLLRGKWQGSYECHVANAGDWLVVWRTGNGIASFQRTGSHDDIFRH